MEKNWRWNIWPKQYLLNVSFYVFLDLPLSFWLDQKYQRGVAPADSWNWGKWGLREYILKGPFLGWFHGLLVPVQENLSWLVCSSRPRTKYCCLTVHYFNTFYPIAQQAWQAVVPCRLSLNMCLWAGDWLYYSIQCELHRESAISYFVFDYWNNKAAQRFKNYQHTHKLFILWDHRFIHRPKGDS